MAYSTLSQFYTSKGQKLPSLQERSGLYSQYGLGTGYAGTAEQNTALLSKLMTPTPSPTPVQAPMPASLNTQNTMNTQNLTRVPTSSVGSSGPVFDVFSGSDYIKDPTDPRLSGVNIGSLPIGTAPQGFQSSFNTPPSLPNNTGNQMPPPPPGISTPPPSMINYEDEIRKSMQPTQDELSTGEQIDNIYTSRDLGVEKIRQQPVAMDFITGQSAGVQRQAAIQAETLEKKLSRLQAQRQISFDVSKFQLDRKDEQKKFDADERYRNATLNQVKPSSQPSSVQEYEYAKSQGYTGTYNDYQTLDANRKASIARAGAGGTGGLTPNQTQSQITGIVNQFDSEPIVKNYNVISEGYQFANSLVNKANPTSADDQGLIYAFAKAMDPTSAVKEGEYISVQKYAQSMAQTGWANLQRMAQNVAFLTPEARKNIIATINSKFQASQQNYNNVYREYNRRLEDAKSGRVGGSLTDYGGAYNAGSGGGANISDLDFGLNK